MVQRLNGSTVQRVISCVLAEHIHTHTHSHTWSNIADGERERERACLLYTVLYCIYIYFYILIHFRGGYGVLYSTYTYTYAIYSSNTASSACQPVSLPIYMTTLRYTSESSVSDVEYCMTTYIFPRRWALH